MHGENAAPSLGLVGLNLFPPVLKHGPWPLDDPDPVTSGQQAYFSQSSSAHETGTSTSQPAVVSMR